MLTNCSITPEVMSLQAVPCVSLYSSLYLLFLHSRCVVCSQICRPSQKQRKQRQSHVEKGVKKIIYLLHEEKNNNKKTNKQIMHNASKKKKSCNNPRAAVQIAFSKSAGLSEVVSLVTLAPSCGSKVRYL